MNEPVNILCLQFIIDAAYNRVAIEYSRYKIAKEKIMFSAIMHYDADDNFDILMRKLNQAKLKFAVYYVPHRLEYDITLNGNWNKTIRLKGDDEDIIETFKTGSFKKLHLCSDNTISLAINKILEQILNNVIKNHGA